MANYTFLRNIETSEIAMVNSEKIETLNVYQTYDRNGQMLGHDLAGTYLTLLTEEAVAFANELGKGYGFQVGDQVSAWEGLAYGEFSQIFARFDGTEHIDAEVATCTGFTYWDGHNWKTIVLEGDDYTPEWEIIGDKKEVAALKRAYTLKRKIRSGFGEEVFAYGKYEITESQFQHSWDIATFVVQ